MAAPAGRHTRPAPEPLDVDAVWIVAAGTALWFLAFLVLLPFRGRLADAGNEVLIWTCLTGGLLGLVGLPLTVRQRAAARRARSGAGSAEITVPPPLDPPPPTA